MTTAAFPVSAEDDRYIRSRFVTVDWLSARSRVSSATLLQWQSRGLFPKPTYVTEDGEQWYPRTYAPLIQRTVYLKTDLKALFQEDYRRALEQLRYMNPADFRAELANSSSDPPRTEDVIQTEWESFLTGQYGVCLRVAWVPCILRKSKLMRTIEDLVAHPKVDAPGWKRRLRQNVESLDRLEMPFASLDRIRFGKRVSRDTHIQDVRARFPQVFGEPRDKSSVDRPATTHGPLLAAEC